ncbi:hypothetical protein QR680_019334 [Steinernema hermaphroditum]|uniref:Uncharacterized protein n=1 Tax=Steinernema hermaphroditum TaxID=289476 RepID=A0AA39LAX7_9BILA|nr:hypothetical protein QR680_019334 [Steinernema hermaphroditum]
MEDLTRSSASAPSSNNERPEYFSTASHVGPDGQDAQPSSSMNFTSSYVRVTCSRSHTGFDLFDDNTELAETQNYSGNEDDIYKKWSHLPETKRYKTDKKMPIDVFRDRYGQRAVIKLIAEVEKEPAFYKYAKAKTVDDLNAKAKEGWKRIICRIKEEFENVQEDHAYRAWRYLKGNYTHKDFRKDWKGRIPFLGGQWTAATLVDNNEKQTEAENPCLASPSIANPHYTHDNTESGIHSAHSIDTHLSCNADSASAQLLPDMGDLCTLSGRNIPQQHTLQSTSLELFDEEGSAIQGPPVKSLDSIRAKLRRKILMKTRSMSSEFFDSSSNSTDAESDCSISKADSSYNPTSTSSIHIATPEEHYQDDFGIPHPTPLSGERLKEKLREKILNKKGNETLRYQHAEKWFLIHSGNALELEQPLPELTQNDLAEAGVISNNQGFGAKFQARSVTSENRHAQSIKTMDRHNEYPSDWSGCQVECINNNTVNRKPSAWLQNIFNIVDSLKGVTYGFTSTVSPELSIYRESWNDSVNSTGSSFIGMLILPEIYIPQ